MNNKWNELSYNKYRNRNNELWNESDVLKEKKEYEDYYNDSIFSVEDLFNDNKNDFE